MTRSLLFAFAVTLIAAPAFGQEALFGGGLTYGSDINRPGLQLHGYYAFGPRVPGLRVGGDVDGFLAHNDDGDNGTAKTTWYDIDANAQYVFLTREDSPFNAYALAGLNLAILGTSFDYDPGIDQRNFSEHTTRLGVNIGAGTEYTLPFAAAFLEAKYVISDADQLVITLGLRFALPLSKTEARVEKKSEDS